MTTNRNQQDNNVPQQEQDHHYHNNYNTHGPGRVPREALALIREAYVANIAPQLTQAAAHLIEQAIESGMDADTIILAIEETGLASSPSPYYLRAILHNWAESGVTVSRTRDIIRTNTARPWWK